MKEKKTNILVVDDILDNINLATNILISNNYDVGIAENGEKALIYAKTKLPDLILLDIMMPEIDGFEVCEKLKANKITKNIPIIFLSAKTNTEDIVRGFEVGAVDYISKPFVKAEFIARVNTHIKLKKINAELSHTKNNLDTILNNVEDAIFIFNEQGDFIETNKTTQTRFGYSKNELLSMNVEDISIPEKFVNFNLDIENIKKHGKITFETIQKSKKGKLIPSEITASSINYEGKTAYLTVSRNIAKRKEYEQKLKESKEKYKTIIENLNDVYYRTDTNGKILMLSPSAINTFGYANLDEIIGTSIIKYYKKANNRTKFINLLKYKGKLENFNTVMLKKDGTEIFTETSSNILLDKNNKYIGVEGIIRDITERKNAEKLIKLSEKKYRIIFEKNNSAVLIMDKDKIVDCNEEAVKLFVSKDKYELIDNSFSQISPKKQPNNNISKKQSDINIENAYKKGTCEFEWTHKKSTGEEFPVKVLLSLIPSKDKNMLYATYSDLTASKNAEKEINILSVAVEQSGNTIVITDKKGNIEYTNPTFTKSTGYTKKEALGKNTRILNSGTHSKAFYADMWEMLLSGKKWKGELKNKKKNGNLYWENATISPVKDKNGEIKKYIAIKEDITIRKKIEAELEKRTNNLEELIKDRTKELEVSRNKFKNIFDSSSDAIVITDLKGNLLDLNKIAAKSIGISQKNINKFNLIEFYNLKGSKSIDTYFKDVVKDGQKLFTIEITLNKKKYHIELNGKRIKHNKIKAILHISRDITERQEAEKQKLNTIIQTEEKERKRFAQDLHDGIGATLSAAKMYMNIAKRAEPGSERAIKMLNEALSLVDDAGKNAKEIAVNIRPHDLAHFGLAISLQNFTDKLNSIGTINVRLNTNNFEIKLNEDIELNIFRLINELVNNTLKYAYAKDIEIELFEENKNIIVKYSDNGKGFDYEKIMKTRKKGTGLDNIINRTKLIGGNVEINSKPNKGMTAKISIVM